MTAATAVMTEIPVMMTETTEPVVTSSDAVTAAHTVTVAPAVYGRLLVMEKPPGRFRHEMKYGLDGTADIILSSRLLLKRTCDMTAKMLTGISAAIRNPNASLFLSVLSRFIVLPP